MLNTTLYGFSNCKDSEFHSQETPFLANLLCQIVDFSLRRMIRSCLIFLTVSGDISGVIRVYFLLCLRSLASWLGPVGNMRLHTPIRHACKKVLRSLRSRHRRVVRQSPATFSDQPAGRSLSRLLEFCARSNQNKHETGTRLGVVGWLFGLLRGHRVIR